MRERSAIGQAGTRTHGPGRESGFPLRIQCCSHAITGWTQAPSDVTIGAMVEVKGPGDRLQDNQRRFLEFCTLHHMPVFVCRVQPGHRRSIYDTNQIPGSGNCLARHDL
jgi:hypothetical protein